MRSLNSGAILGMPNLPLLLFNAVCRGCLTLIVTSQGNVDFPPNRQESGCLASEVARAHALRGLRYHGIMAEAHPALVAVIIADTQKNDGHVVEYRPCDGCGDDCDSPKHMHAKQGGCFTALSGLCCEWVALRLHTDSNHLEGPHEKLVI